MQHLETNDTAPYTASTTLSAGNNNAAEDGSIEKQHMSATIIAWKVETQ